MRNGAYIERRFSLFFVELIGGDYKLLVSSGNKVIHRFFAASVSLVLVFLVSILSVYYGTDLLFHIWQAEILLAVFISLLFGCIYIFLLATLSRVTSQSRFLNLSNIIRLGFLAFMAFLISKPVEVFVFSGKLDAIISQHKNDLLTGFKEKLSQIYSIDQDKLLNEIQLLEARFSQYPLPAYENELDQLKQQMQHLENDRLMKLGLAEKRISQSDFLLVRIEHVIKEPGAWITFFIILVLFFLPGYFIYTIPRDHVYYEKKQQHEQEMVLAEYQRFCERYRQIFLKNWGLTVDIYSVFEDPPFNTLRKSQVQALPKSEFLKRYLGKS